MIFRVLMESSENSYFIADDTLLWLLLDISCISTFYFVVVANFITIFSFAWLSIELEDGKNHRNAYKIIAATIEMKREKEPKCEKW